MVQLTEDTADLLLSQPVDDNSVFTTKELAKKLNVSERFLKKLREKGTGPLYSKIGGRVLYLWADVRVFLNTYKRRSTSDTGENTKRMYKKKSDDYKASVIEDDLFSLSSPEKKKLSLAKQSDSISQQPLLQ